jgi:hypothetical protein
MCIAINHLLTPSGLSRRAQSRELRDVFFRMEQHELVTSINHARRRGTFEKLIEPKSSKIV